MPHKWESALGFSGAKPEEKQTASFQNELLSLMLDMNIAEFRRLWNMTTISHLDLLDML